MCMMCDGAQINDVIAGMRQKITDHGYTTVSIDAAASPAAYTLGMHTHGLPELYIADPIASRLLNALATLHLTTPLHCGEVIAPAEISTQYLVAPFPGFTSLPFVHDLYGADAARVTGYQVSYLPEQPADADQIGMPLQAQATPPVTLPIFTKPPTR